MEPVTDFKFYVKFAKPLILNLPKISDRILASAWVKRLSEDTSDKLKLDYIKLLLFVLQRKTLATPFTQHPNSVETLQEFPDNQTLADIARRIVTEDLVVKVKQPGGDLPRFWSDFSCDLLEYAAVQNIEHFGVHGYYAISTQPLHHWHRVDKQVVPRAAKSLLEVTTTPANITGTISADKLMKTTPTELEYTPPAAEDIPRAAEDIPPAAEDIPPAADDIPPAAEDISPAAEDTPSAEEEPPPPPQKPAEPPKVKRKPVFGFCPPSKPLGKILPEGEREPITWGSNLLEVTRHFKLDDSRPQQTGLQTEVLWTSTSKVSTSTKTPHKSHNKQKTDASTSRTLGKVSAYGRKLTTTSPAIARRVPVSSPRPSVVPSRTAKEHHYDDYETRGEVPEVEPEEQLPQPPEDVLTTPLASPVPTPTVSKSRIPVATHNISQISVKASIQSLDERNKVLKLGEKQNIHLMPLVNVKYKMQQRLEKPTYQFMMPTEKKVPGIQPKQDYYVDDPVYQPRITRSRQQVEMWNRIKAKSPEGLALGQKPSVQSIEGYEYIQAREMKSVKKPSYQFREPTERKVPGQSDYQPPPARPRTSPQAPRRDESQYQRELRERVRPRSPEGLPLGQKPSIQSIEGYEYIQAREMKSVIKPTYQFREPTERKVPGQSDYQPLPARPRTSPQAPKREESQYQKDLRQRISQQSLTFSWQSNPSALKLGEGVSSGTLSGNIEFRYVQPMEKPSAEFMGPVPRKQPLDEMELRALSKKREKRSHKSAIPQRKPTEREMERREQLRGEQFSFGYQPDPQALRLGQRPPVEVLTDVGVPYQKRQGMEKPTHQFMPPTERGSSTQPWSRIQRQESDYRVDLYENVYAQGRSSDLPDFNPSTKLVDEEMREALQYQSTTSRQPEGTTTYNQQYERTSAREHYFEETRQESMTSLGSMDPLNVDEVLREADHYISLLTSRAPNRPKSPRQ